jgi:pimeloyl-ACP methyl ester carboxylesterase
VRAATGDGNGRLVLHDWGGDGPPILLAHPTGFHGTVWLPVARRLVAASRHVYSFDFRGHGLSSRSSAGYDWSVFADDVLTVVDALGLTGDATLLPAGHSKGGAAFLLAEAQAPGTFARIWCYEPIVIPGAPARLDENDVLVAGALRRRDAWDSREAAFAAFASRPPLGLLDRDAVRAYVERGFVDAADGDGVVLACRPEDEAEMYALRAAHDAWRVLPDVRCPVHVVCGDATDAMTPKLCERVVARLPEATLEVRPGLGHFGPLQDPAGAAESILAFAYQA